MARVCDWSCGHRVAQLGVDNPLDQLQHGAIKCIISRANGVYQVFSHCLGDVGMAQAYHPNKSTTPHPYIFSFNNITLLPNTKHNLSNNIILLLTLSL